MMLQVMSHTQGRCSHVWRPWQLQIPCTFLTEILRAGGRNPFPAEIGLPSLFLPAPLGLMGISESLSINRDLLFIAWVFSTVGI